jgi:hypothetical protein
LFSDIEGFQGACCSSDKSIVLPRSDINLLVSILSSSSFFFLDCLLKLLRVGVEEFHNFVISLDPADFNKE